MIYMASPHNHPDPFFRERRYIMAMAGVKHLLEKYPDKAIYCPILHWHHVAQVLGLQHGFEFWRVQDFGMLKFAEKLIVLRIEGWDTSRGVKAEIEFAEKNNIPVEYL